MKLVGGETKDGTKLSLPSRERGLKCVIDGSDTTKEGVAPLAGAWIEILRELSEKNGLYVAPLAGAWIEMSLLGKYIMGIFVAPLAGAWIEIV